MQSFDLIVVGGGILGTFHAYHALALGKSVLIVEKDSLPMGATVRNFGQIVPSGLAGKWFQYGVRSLEIYQQLQKNADLTVQPYGSVYIASDPDECRLIHELKNHYDTMGYPTELHSCQQLQQKYPVIKASYAKEALAFIQEIGIDPREMIHRLHKYMLARFSGCQIHYNSPVIECTPKGNQVYLKTVSGQEYEAGKAVICNGYEFKLLYADYFAKSGITVNKLQMLRTSPMPRIFLKGNILTGLSIRRYESFKHYCPSFDRIKMPAHYALLESYGIHLLFKQSADGSIILGDSHQNVSATHYDQLGFTMNQSINNCILQEAKRIANIDIDQIASSWVGYYSEHKNKHIFEKDIHPNIHIRTAIGGKGMTASPGYAEQSIKIIYG